MVEQLVVTHFHHAQKFISIGVHDSGQKTANHTIDQKITKVQWAVKNQKATSNPSASVSHVANQTSLTMALIVTGYQGWVDGNIQLAQDIPSAYALKKQLINNYKQQGYTYLGNESHIKAQFASKVKNKYGSGWSSSLQKDPIKIKNMIEDMFGLLSNMGYSHPNGVSQAISANLIWRACEIGGSPAIANFRGTTLKTKMDVLQACCHLYNAPF